MIEKGAAWRPFLLPDGKTRQCVIQQLKPTRQAVTDTSHEILSRRHAAFVAIRTIPDYPKPGILFRDITTLLGNARAFRRAIDELVHPYAGAKIDKIAGIEARGFILGGAIAHQLSAGFIPIRKKGKLPHETVRVAYSLEYGLDEMEMHKDAVAPARRSSSSTI